jgi:hypothetical protein
MIAFAKYLGPDYIFYDLHRPDQIIPFLDTKIKSTAEDPDKRWITTWNYYLRHIKHFLRWLHNNCASKGDRGESLHPQDRMSDKSDWETPPAARIKKKRTKRESPYSGTEIWDRAELFTIVKYEPEIRNKAIIALLWDLNARNHEITSLRIRNIRLRELYAEGEIPHNTKTGGGPILLTCSFPYVRDWLNKHPFKNTPEARLICNLQNAPIKPDSLCAIMKQLRHRIIRMLESGMISNLEEKQKLEYLLRTKKWNPYCLRHSAITYDSDYLPEYAIKKKARWSMNSRQGSRYIKSRMGGDLKRAILVQNGIALLGGDDDAKSSPSVRDCPRCNLINTFESKYCSKCSYPLAPDDRINRMELSDRLDSLKELEKEFWEPEKQAMYIPLTKQCETCEKIKEWYEFPNRLNNKSVKSIFSNFPLQTKARNWLERFMIDEIKYIKENTELDLVLSDYSWWDSLVSQNLINTTNRESEINSILDLLKKDEDSVPTMSYKILRHLPTLIDLQSMMKEPSNSHRTMQLSSRNKKDARSMLLDLYSELYEILLEYKIRILEDEFIIIPKTDRRICNILDLGMAEYIMKAIRLWFQDSLKNKCFNCSTRNTCLICKQSKPSSKFDRWIKYSDGTQHVEIRLKKGHMDWLEKSLRSWSEFNRYVLKSSQNSELKEIVKDFNDVSNDILDLITCSKMHKIGDYELKHLPPNLLPRAKQQLNGLDYYVFRPRVTHLDDLKDILFGEYDNDKAEEIDEIRFSTNIIDKKMAGYISGIIEKQVQSYRCDECSDCIERANEDKEGLLNRENKQ